jgi:tRNA-dihydrouridine synthase B
MISSRCIAMEKFFLTDNPLRAFQIGSLKLVNPLILAPLAGISDLPFRLLAKEQGAALVYTEMISAEGLVRSFKKTCRLLQSCPEERPLSVQLFGSKAETLAEAAKMVESSGADALDINMGCPVRKVVGGGSGAALLKDIKKIEEICKAVRRNITIPFTIKFRSGWDEKTKNFLEVAKVAEDCGVDGVAIHGRTRTQSYGIKADWEDIRRAKDLLRVPVIGNGDMTTPRAIVDFFSQTGCLGAMIGRGALGNPWIFREALGLLQGKQPPEPSLVEKEATVFRHLEMMLSIRGEFHTLREFRKHLIWYTRGLRGSSEFRFQIPHWKTIPHMAEKIREFFGNLNISL